ncbi:IclR family transcriptional regulator domain-containing protein [Streptomyces armeniacus]|uniref:IclR family transcriptional regulator domain-containing protein n=1 Tax=Streptomyces armeniacus TaxID=83291 RepID=UPI001FE5FC84|nr:IclR family transcriptional regulator C-terminal domain-containing protein [Streptomyces armeniacus]
MFRVQEALSRLGPGAHRLSAIARAADLDDSTTSRILQSGVYRGHFERPSRGRYQLGGRVAELALHAYARHDSDSVLAVLQQLRARTDGGMALHYTLTPGVQPGRQCAEMAVGDSDLEEFGMSPREVLAITRSLRVGASGRTILAYLPEAVQCRAQHEPIPPQAGRGAIHNPVALAASLAAIRDHGYALGYEECMDGWNTIAAPTFAGVAIQGAVLLLRPARLMPRAPRPYITATKTAAAAISRMHAS